ncbi:organoarsenical effux MFS transporter ArsJ [bacterium SCSIO 12696]|nr:organoarsenical effux MFS transporter ArsJ [bacterium SCSIO 12696]
MPTAPWSWRRWSAKLNLMSTNIRQYLLITGNYWAFTLTDGALRMLVVLHFHQLGYSPLAIASLFLFYELFGVITNLVGGWLGAKIGLNRTMNIGLALQIAALLMLCVQAELLTVFWVMCAQAISGIAKDLNKMSAKSAVKFLLPEHAQGKLYKWVAILTGSKNTLKGAGFFLGAGLLALLGFQQAMLAMAIALAVVWVISLTCLGKDLGRASNKPKFRQVFSKSRAINILSVARLFLFGARDVWFVVALPVYLSSVLEWSHWTVGSFLACWVIGYGIIQASAPAITGQRAANTGNSRQVVAWGIPLALSAAIMALALHWGSPPAPTLIIGLMLFGALFAINSSLHSYLIVSFANRDSASLDVGFYYMANAMGRLIGTLLSGWVYQSAGLQACLWLSAGFLFISVVAASRLQKQGQVTVPANPTGS